MFRVFVGAIKTKDHLANFTCANQTKLFRRLDFLVDRECIEIIQSKEIQSLLFGKNIKTGITVQNYGGK